MITAIVRLGPAAVNGMVLAAVGLLSRLSEVGWRSRHCLSRFRRTSPTAPPPSDVEDGQARSPLLPDPTDGLRDCAPGPGGCQRGCSGSSVRPTLKRVGRTRLEDADRVTEKPTLEGSLQQAALAAGHGQRPVAGGADGPDVPTPGTDLMCVAFEGGQGELESRGPGAEDA